MSERQWNTKDETIDAKDAEIERLKKSIRSMISAAGLPDSKEACITIIEWGKETLKESEK